MAYTQPQIFIGDVGRRSFINVEQPIPYPEINLCLVGKLFAFMTGQRQNWNPTRWM